MNSWKEIEMEKRWLWREKLAVASIRLLPLDVGIQSFLNALGCLTESQLKDGFQRKVCMTDEEQAAYDKEQVEEEAQWERQYQERVWVGLNRCTSHFFTHTISKSS